MTHSLISDELNQLHLQILKSTVMISLLIPIHHIITEFVHQIDSNSQIIFGFILFSILCSSIILAFIFALKVTVSNFQLTDDRNERMCVNVYKHLPMLYFSFISIFIYSQISLSILSIA